MKKGLIQDRLERANKVDYINARDVQMFIQEKVNQEAFLDWCRKPTERIPVSPLCIPSKFYQRERVRSWWERWWLSGLIP